MDDGGKTGLGKDDIGGTTSSVGSSLDGDTNISTGQGGSVVGTVTSHGAEMSETLETLDNLILVLREHTGETIGIHDHLVQAGVLSTGSRAVLEHLGRVHVITQAETTSSFLCDSELITGNHLDANTEGKGIVNGLLGIVTGGIVDGEETDEFESITVSLEIVTVNFLKGNSESAETTSGVLLDILLKTVLDVVGLVAGAKFDDDTSHTLGDTLKLAGGFLAVGDLGTLVDGVEWLEIEELDARTGAGWVTNGSNDGGIDGVLVLGTRSIGGEENDVLSREGAICLDGVAIDGQLVGGESTGLVRAQDGDTSQLLNSRDTGDNGLVFGELLSTDGESDGQDSGHGNGNTTNEEDKDVVETTTVLVAEASVQDKDFGEDENTDGDQAEGTDLSKNLLQVTGGVVILADEGSGTTEESVGSSGNDNTLSFTLFASGTAEE